MRRAMIACVSAIAMTAACGREVSLGTATDPDIVTGRGSDAASSETPACEAALGMPVSGSTPTDEIAIMVGGGWAPCESDDPLLSGDAIDFASSDVLLLANADAGYELVGAGDTFIVGAPIAGANEYQLRLTAAEGESTDYAMYVFVSPARLRLIDLTSGAYSDYVPSEQVMVDAGLDN